MIEVETRESGWDRRMRETRAALQRHARRLFVSRGFTATTAQEIAAAAGVSERTFFRYFATKEEVALSGFRQRGEAMVAALAARPEDESLLDSVRAALTDMATGARSQAERIEEYELISACPELLVPILQLTFQWEDELTDIIEVRQNGPGDRLRARVLAASFTTIIRTAILQSIETDGLDDRLFYVARQALEIMAPLYE